MGYKFTKVEDSKDWLSYDLDKDTAEEFKAYLRKHEIYFEPSSNGNLIHFEVKVDGKETLTEMVEDFFGKTNINDLSPMEGYIDFKEKFGKKIANEVFRKDKFRSTAEAIHPGWKPEDLTVYITTSDGKKLTSITGKLLVFNGEEKAKEYAEKKNLTNYKINLVPFESWLINSKLVDSKQVNDNVINLLNQLQSSLKGAYNLASGLKQQLPQQQPTTNEEKALYNGKFITSLENIADNVSRWYKEIEGYKKEFAKAHIVIEELLESFPLEARTKLRESENPEETYNELVEDLKNRYNSLPNKEDYKEQVIKMKKDLDGFYKNTFKK